MHPYASAEYAAAFQPLQSVYLPNARTHLLERSVPGSSQIDLMGCYPLCVLDSNPALANDLSELAAGEYLSMVMVTDCLTQPSEAFLRAHFETCRSYKTHFVHDARLPNSTYSKHHRDRVRLARRTCETRVVELGDYISEWMACYETLVQKKNITGIQNFSRTYFEAVAALPSATTVAAFVDGQFVSAHIWIRHDTSVYAHLAASTPLGYKVRAAFAIYDHAIELFRESGVIDFGGGAGVEAGKVDGLADFKKGFANDEKRNFLCGKVLNHAAYGALCAERGIDPQANFFPAYRDPRAFSSNSSGQSDARA